MSFFEELRRRNVAKVAVAYAVVGWLLVQVADTFFPALQLPEWTVTFVAGLVILGFPLALILSWAYELTPEGMKKSQEVPATESVTHSTGRKLDFAIIGALVLALGLVVYEYVLPDGEEVSNILSNSVAVLPFENLSPDPDNAYFAAGMHEEILNQLVKIRELNVISRTSVLKYAENRPSIPEIAAELNVQAVMEGSIRFDGENVLIQTQLIDGETDSHLWSEGYERELADIFEIQADVAMNVANALEVQFSVAEQERIERHPTVSDQAYDLYLQAKALPRLRKIPFLDAAIALDPEFALAIATRAFTVASLMYYGGFYDEIDISREESEREVLEAVDYALSLDENLGAAYSARALIHEMNWRWAEAEEAHERAVAIDAKDPLTLQRFASFRRRTGDFSESVRLTERAIPLDPANSRTYHHVGIARMYARAHEDAVEAFERALALGSSGPTLFGQFISLTALGRENDAFETLLEYDRGASRNAPNNLAFLSMAYAMANRPAEAERFLRELEDLSQSRNVGSANLAVAHLAVGDEATALQRFEQAIEQRSLEDRIVLSHLKANIWQDDRLEGEEFRRLRDLVTPLRWQQP